MIRWSVAIVHIALGSLLGLSSLLLLAQTRVNAVWETTFYDSVQPLTAAFGMAAGILLFLSVTAISSALVYLLDVRWGRQALFVSSCILIIVLPAPLALLVLTSSLAATATHWQKTSRAP